LQLTIPTANKLGYNQKGSDCQHPQLAAIHPTTHKQPLNDKPSKLTETAEVGSKGYMLAVNLCECQPFFSSKNQGKIFSSVFSKQQITEATTHISILELSVHPFSQNIKYIMAAAKDMLNLAWPN